MKFNKYTSINNSYREKLIDKINNQVTPSSLNQPFVVLEKIHGTNFGIHIDRHTAEVRFSKRSGFLGDNASFYTYEKVKAQLERAAKMLLTYVKSGTVLSVYGELFGGNFYGETKQGSKKVQSGVNYHPDTCFMAFDLMIDGQYIYWAKAERVLRDAGFAIAPTIKVANNFNEALEVNETFNSMVPLSYGLIAQDNENFAEGVVIKPMQEEIYLNDKTRLILKKKTEKFSEKGSKKKVKTKVKLSDDCLKLLEDVSAFITSQRLVNVLSKLEDNLTHKDFGKVCGLLMKDAIDDYDKEVEGSIKEVLGDDWKTFNGELKKLSADFLRKTWQDILED